MVTKRNTRENTNQLRIEISSKPFMKTWVVKISDILTCSAIVGHNMCNVKIAYLIKTVLFICNFFLNCLFLCKLCIANSIYLGLMDIYTERKKKVKLRTYCMQKAPTIIIFRLRSISLVLQNRNETCEE